AGTTGCGIGSAAVASGQQTLTLSEITQGDGAYVCTITFTDSAGNAASALTLTSFTIDNAVATPTETTAVTTPTNDATPDVVITTTQAGTIAVGGTSGCGVGSAAVSSGQQTVTLAASGGDKAYTCTVTFTDSAGNAASALTLTAFTLDTTANTPAETTAVTSPTKDTSPDVVITTDEVGTIAVGGTTGCGVGSAAVSSGQQTITLSTITQGDGAYVCTITFSDALGTAATALTMTSFTLDTTAPSVTITSVATNTYVNAAEYAAGFNVIGTTNAEDGETVTVIYGVGAGAATSTCTAGSSAFSCQFTNAVLEATNSDAGISDGNIVVHADVNDQADNSATTAVGFAIQDTSVPSVSETTAVAALANDNTPNVVITSTQAGSLSYSTCTFGSATASTIAASSATTLTLDSNGAGGALADASYASCKISVTDDAGNAGTVTLTTFEIDTAVATPSETTAISTPTNDETPSVVITTTQAGTIVVAGTTGCGIASAAVVSGEQTLTLSEITQGDATYTCTITFTDSAGNAAGALTLTAFVLDNAVATPTETTAVTTPTKDTSPDVVITTTQAGTIVVGGTTGCGIGSAAVASGQQTLTLSTITQGDGAYVCT
ncbi:uncharacterized protein METZ01_LOCUS188538, partial [marine metagenome]